MLKFITDWFGKKPDPRAEAPAVVVAPYKVESSVQPAPTTAPAPVAEVAPHNTETSAAIPVAGLMLTVEGTGAVKVAPKKKAAPKKPAAAKVPATPRAPRKPRAK